MATTTITATCACGTFNLKVELPDESLPIDCALCLCNSCRNVTGSCASSRIAIPPSQKIQTSDFDLTAHNTSYETTYYFCSTCGSHVLYKSAKQESWQLSTGILERTEGIVNWKGCKWVADTLDGGISVWLKVIEGAAGVSRPLRRWMLGDTKDGDLVPHSSLKALPAKDHTQIPEDRRLQAKCHCGGVKFYITRPNESSKKVWSPHPDLMVPYHSTISAKNTANDPWWLQENDTKYLAGTCACTSCRLNLGAEIQTWAFIPKPNIFQDDGNPLGFSMGTLRTYASSEGVWREFCRVCGATVFWHCAERPDVIDVSAGLFDREKGARVEEWLSWWKGRVSFRELCVSHSLVDSLESGMRFEEESDSSGRRGE